MANLSAAGLQKGMLELLRHASLKRLGRIVSILQTRRVQVAVEHWQRVSKFEGCSERHKGTQGQINHAHSTLSNEHDKEIAELRRDWKTCREQKLQEIGFHQEDQSYVAVPAEHVHHLRALDKSFKDELNKKQEEHLQNYDKLSGTCRQLLKEHDTKMQAMVLLTVGAQMAGRHKHSRSASGRTWQLEDMDASVLQWAFTRPPDPCMVPFPQAVAMEDQHEVLAKTCRLIFEYADKLPRWGQLASVNQGRVVARRPSKAAAILFKSLIRRLQVRCALQPAFAALRRLAPRRSRQGSGASPSKDAWQRARAGIRNYVKRQQEADKQKETSEDKKDFQSKGAKKMSMHISSPASVHNSLGSNTSMPQMPHKLQSATDVERSEARSKAARSRSSWDHVLENTQNRLGRSVVSAPFQLGGDIADDSPRHPSPHVHTTRARAATTDHSSLDRQKSTAESTMPLADETPATGSTSGRHRGRAQTTATAGMYSMRPGSTRELFHDAAPSSEDTSTSPSPKKDLEETHIRIHNLESDHVKLPPTPTADMVGREQAHMRIHNLESDHAKLPAMPRFSVVEREQASISSLHHVADVAPTPAHEVYQDHPEHHEASSSVPPDHPVHERGLPTSLQQVPRAAAVVVDVEDSDSTSDSTSDSGASADMPHLP